MTAITAYEMNPQEDYLAFTDELTEGMWIMPEDPRARCSDIAPEDEQLRANRFCRIVRMRPADDFPTMILIVEWADGYQKRLSSHKNGTWIVKRDHPSEPVVPPASGTETAEEGA